jgi:hypothetical protein
MSDDDRYCFKCHLKLSDDDSDNEDEGDEDEDIVNECDFCGKYYCNKNKCYKNCLFDDNEKCIKCKGKEEEIIDQRIEAENKTIEQLKMSLKFSKAVLNSLRKELSKYV